MLRCIFFICAKFAISLTAEQLPRCLNGAADALSRGDMASFIRVVPYAAASSDCIPAVLLEVLIQQRPNWLSTEWSVAFQGLSLVEYGEVMNNELLTCSN